MATTTVPTTRPQANDPASAAAGEHANEHLALFERARRREPGALAELITRCHPIVERAARRTCGNSSDADDVMQEVWIALMIHIDTIRSPACLPGWLHRVTVNAAIQQGRRRSRSVLFAAVPEGPRTHDDDDAIRRLTRDATRIGVRRALDRLRAADRELLGMLMEGDRPDYVRISRHTRRPVGSIGPTRQRLLGRLRNDPAIVALAAG